MVLTFSINVAAPALACAAKLWELGSRNPVEVLQGVIVIHCLPHTLSLPIQRWVFLHCIIDFRYCERLSLSFCIIFGSRFFVAYCEV